MKRTAVHSTSTRSTDNDGDRGAPEVAAFGGEVGDLVKAAGNEIRKLHFCDGAHAHQGSTNRGADDAGLRNGRIHTAQLPELFEHAVGDFERAAVEADIFADDEDTLVTFH